MDASELPPDYRDTNGVMEWLVRVHPSGCTSVRLQEHDERGEVCWYEWHTFESEAIAYEFLGAMTEADDFVTDYLNENASHEAGAN